MPSIEDHQPVEFRLERTINVRWHGSHSTGLLTIGPIRWLEERGAWACFWAIHQIHPEEAKLYGDDPMQALERTIRFVSHLIRGSIEDGIGIWWQEEGDECGFWAEK